MTDKPRDEEPRGWALSGCALTLLVWLFAAMLMLGTFGGDCLPELGHQCPSDHERAISLIWVGLGAVVFNAVGLFVLAWLHARSGSRR
jgi:hypothetical protein